MFPGDFVHVEGLIGAGIAANDASLFVDNFEGDWTLR
jgi:hypothetical protein